MIVTKDSFQKLQAGDLLLIEKTGEFKGVFLVKEANPKDLKLITIFDSLLKKESSYYCFDVGDGWTFSFHLIDFNERVVLLNRKI